MVSFTVPAVKMDEVNNRIDSVNRRLSKAGATDFFEIVEEKQENIAYGEEFVPVVHITVNYPVLNAGDYTLVAAVDILEEGTVLRSIAGVNTDNLPRPTEHRCDYCGTKRSRKNSYLLRNNKTGEINHIGKSCLQVFTGVTPALWTLDIDFQDFKITHNDYADYAIKMFNVRDIVRASFVASDRGSNYVSQSKALFNGTLPTSEIVRAMFNNDNYPDDKITTLIQESHKITDDEIDSILNSIENVTGNYGENLRSIIKSKEISKKHFNFAVSIVSAHYNYEKKKQREKELAEQKENLLENKLRHKIMYPPQTRITNIPVTVTNKRKIITESQYSYKNQPTVTIIITFTDNNGDKFTWFSQSNAANNLKENESYNLTATIKNHNEYNGQSQIIITRAKLTPQE